MMDEIKREEIEFALNNSGVYPPMIEYLVHGEIDFLTEALRDTWDALKQAEADNAKLRKALEV